MFTLTADSIESVNKIQTDQDLKGRGTFLLFSFSPSANYSINSEESNKTKLFSPPKFEDVEDSFLRASEIKRSTSIADIPVLEGLDSHNPFLTDRIRRLVDKFWAIIASQALQSTFPINKALVVVFRDPNEDRNKISIKVFTEATASQSVAFWDGLEDDIQEWVKTLDNHSKLLFLRDISLRIHWK
jgi:hypothetical protein